MLTHSISVTIISYLSTLFQSVNHLLFESLKHFPTNYSSISSIYTRLTPSFPLGWIPLDLLTSVPSSRSDPSPHTETSCFPLCSPVWITFFHTCLNSLPVGSQFWQTLPDSESLLCVFPKHWLLTLFGRCYVNLYFTGGFQVVSCVYILS